MSRLSESVTVIVYLFEGVSNLFGMTIVRQIIDYSICKISLEAMNESEIQLFLRVHGESARPFIEKASLLGYIYIFPEPNFGEAVQIALKELMSKRYSWANYVVDFQVFRKPPSRVFHKETIRRDEVAALFEFGKSAYPESSMAWATLGETSWDEIEIY